MFKILLFASMVLVTTLSYASEPIEKTIIGANAQSDRVSIYIWTDANGVKHYSSKPEKNVRHEKKVVVTPRVRENYNYSRPRNNSVTTNSAANNGSTSNLVGVSKPNDYSKNNTNVNVEIPVSAPPSSLPPLPSDFNNN